MIAMLAQHRDEIRALCRRYRVERLVLFGSAVEGVRFTPASDIDFLVEFLPLPEGGHADSYFGLKADLETLLGRPVDLVMRRAVKNKFFLPAAEQHSELMYAA